MLPRCIPPNRVSLSPILSRQSLSMAKLISSLVKTRLFSTLEPRKPLKLRLPTYLALNLSACPSGLVIVNGTDGTSLSIPYLGLAGSLRSAWRIYPGKPVLKIAGADGESTYPSTDAFVFNDLQSGQKPGPSNSVERKDAGASLDKVFVAIHLPLASPKLRLDMVLLTLCSSSLDFKPQNTSQAGPDPRLACPMKCHRVCWHQVRWSTAGIPIQLVLSPNWYNRHYPLEWIFCTRPVRTFWPVSVCPPRSGSIWEPGQ
ncbi:zinc finger domain-containing protein [Metarhizium robertsii ARSEF 23]|uniref:Zinc finger domain-containing protein n=1 Tax=Metarhizium robertsii (strain ARSEF 23 / ATCC MYA-3075) TaxID=655844 RepID=A0A0B2XFI6_METRA|nr:zinc finger domain-containing protein [Metarhizium robertsii ARSEF 23]KHO10789.1 zinc finger domain-containing protein [Metarhizium robertsii ARSEF 23]